MKPVVIIAIAFVLFIPTSVFAQIIDFTTDEEIYYQFQTITISGVVDVDPDISGIFVEIFNPEQKLVGVDTRDINLDGTFSTEWGIHPSIFTIDGEYTIRITYGNSIEKNFNYQQFWEPVISEEKIREPVISEERIFYKQLTRSDFQATSGSVCGDPITPVIDRSLISCTVMAVTYSKEFHKVDSSFCQYEYSVFIADSYLIPKKSWLGRDSREDSAFSVLRHEQRHFDITEIHARDVESKFLNKKFDCPNGVYDESLIRKEDGMIVKSIMDARNQMHLLYDLETRNNKNYWKQADWNVKIDCMLDNNGPSDYCLSLVYERFGGCLIATATYGSELAPQVQQLREIRDNSLLQTELGRSFMESFNQFYYSFSPTIADLERENPVFKEMIKIAITPLLTSLSILTYVNMDSEVEVLGYGISLILLNVGIYIGLPAMVIVGIRKRF